VSSGSLAGSLIGGAYPCAVSATRAARLVGGVLAAALLAAFAALVLGEYELRGWVPFVAGPVVGVLVAEVLRVATRGGGPGLAAAAAVLAGASLAWAGWIDSDEGVEPYPVGGWVGAALAAVSASARIAVGRSDP